MIAAASLTAFTFGVIVAVAYLFEAREALSEEKDRLLAEREAFAAFTRRVSRLAAGGLPTSQNGTVDRTRPDGGTTPVRSVREAYHETVMSVDHFDADYDESLKTHMAAELGTEVATAVSRHAQVSPPLKGALLEYSRQAQQRRESLLSTLDDEEDVLEDARTRLERVENALVALDDTPLPERSFSELVEVYGRLDGLERDCESVAERRQRAIHDGTTVADDRGDGGELTLQEYLYDPLPTTYPVLASTTDLVRTIETARRRLIASMVRRA